MFIAGRPEWEDEEVVFEGTLKVQLWSFQITHNLLLYYIILCRQVRTHPLSVDLRNGFFFWSDRLAKELQICIIRKLPFHYGFRSLQIIMIDYR